jgi:hypothetical protein
MCRHLGGRRVPPMDLVDEENRSVDELGDDVVEVRGKVAPA